MRAGDWSKIVEGHLLDIMYLSRNSNIPYMVAMSWPRWMVRARVKHIEFWLEREDKASEAAARAHR